MLKTIIKSIFNRYKIITAYNFECTCLGFPTQFEFEDESGNKYYFRYRFGSWTLYNITNEVWKTLIMGTAGDSLDGICSVREFKKLCKKEGYIIKIKSRSDLVE